MSLLNKFELFRGLDNKALGLIKDDLVHVKSKQHEYLFKEGDDCTGIYFLVEGTCEARKTILDQPEIPIAYIPKNSLIGEMGLMHEDKRTASIFFEKPGELLFWSKKKFFDFINLHPKTGLHIMYGLCRIISRRLLIHDSKVVKDPNATKTDKPYFLEFLID